MSFFKRKSTEEMTIVLAGCNKCSERENEDRRDALIKKCEEKLLAESDEVFASFVTEYESQKKGFSFSCQRWGNFLNIYIKRDVNEEYGKNTHYEVCSSYETSINLSKVREIVFTEGNAPDYNGEINYAYSAQKESSEETFIRRDYDWGMKKDTPCKVFPVLPMAPHCRRIFKNHQSDQQGLRGNSSNILQYVTKNYPRLSQDDQIYFAGADLIIYAPFGMGKQIRDQMVSAEDMKGKAHE